MNPLAPDFWEQYTKFMESTLQNTQRLIAELGSNPAARFKEGSIGLAGSPPWIAENGPEIKIDDDYLHLTFAVKDQALDNNNTRVALEGSHLLVEGALQAKVALPVAVRKYGGRAVYKDRSLYVRLLRDKYNTQAVIPISQES